MLKTVFTIIASYLSFGESQLLIGSQRDSRGCSLDGGYQWCESLNRCLRPWETPCALAPVSATSSVPSDCSEWFDGCNHCMVRDGQIAGCTRMMCLTQGNPRCLRTRTPNIGDICYRFCEDNSETAINQRTQCPLGSSCVSPSSEITTDSCGNRAWRCSTPH
jgi:hypothetical protein